MSDSIEEGYESQGAPVVQMNRQIVETQGNEVPPGEVKDNTTTYKRAFIATAVAGFAYRTNKTEDVRSAIPVEVPQVADFEEPSSQCTACAKKVRKCKLNQHGHRDAEVEA